MNDTIHTWEHEGLGKAPFRWAGVYSFPSKSLAEANPEAYNRALASKPSGFACGTCQHCGRPLTNNALVLDANNSKIVVGLDCIIKHGDRGLTTKAKAWQRDRRREKLAQKRAEEFAAREARIELAHAQQREANPYHLADHELESLYRDWDAAIRADKLQGLAGDLDDNQGGFRSDVAKGLRAGELPYGRGLNIMIDILAKDAGRRGSKAYDAEYDRVGAILDELETN